MRLSNIRVKEGFTLAEVLITLGIIGVVAAMTMPTLMNQTNGAQYKAAYKKALSAISQAVTLNVALDEWNFADLDGKTYTLENMFKNRMNVVRIEHGSFNDAKDSNYEATYTPDVGADWGEAGSANFKPDSSYTTLFFNDGIMFSFKTKDVTACTKADGATEKICHGFIDVNGIKAPNKIVKCDAGKDDTDCKIKNPTDVYPVQFYDQTILPDSVAAKAVLYSK